MHAYVEMNTANESLLRIFWVDDYGCQLLLRKIVQFAFISSILRRSGKELLFPWLSVLRVGFKIYFWHDENIDHEE